MRGLDQQRVAGLVGLVEHRVGEPVQFGELLVEPVERVGDIAVTVAGVRPVAHLHAPRAVEFVGTATGPVFRAQRVQDTAAVVVQLRETGQPVAFIADGKQVSW
ncbi:MAG TPA: hypothetical protein VGJ45_40985 [Pseudonocardiaceae bacterium]